MHTVFVCLTEMVIVPVFSTASRMRLSELYLDSAPMAVTLPDENAMSVLLGFKNFLVHAVYFVGS